LAWARHILSIYNSIRRDMGMATDAPEFPTTLKERSELAPEKARNASATLMLTELPAPLSEPPS